jgi:hypothetical protein
MRHYQPALDFEPWLSTGFGATKMLFRLADTDTFFWDWIQKNMEHKNTWILTYIF